MESYSYIGLVWLLLYLTHNPLPQDIYTHVNRCDWSLQFQVWLLLPLIPILYPRIFILTSTGWLVSPAPSLASLTPQPHPLPQGIYTHINGCDPTLQSQVWLLLPLTPIPYPRIFILTSMDVTGHSSPKSGFSCPSPLSTSQGIYTHINGCNWSLQPQVDLAALAPHPHPLPQDIYTHNSGCDWSLQPEVWLLLSLTLTPTPGYLYSHPWVWLVAPAPSLASLAPHPHPLSQDIYTHIKECDWSLHLRLLLPLTPFPTPGYSY